MLIFIKRSRIGQVLIKEHNKEWKLYYEATRFYFYHESKNIKINSTSRTDSSIMSWVTITSRTIQPDNTLMSAVQSSMGTAISKWDQTDAQKSNNAALEMATVDQAHAEDLQFCLWKKSRFNAVGEC